METLKEKELKNQSEEEESRDKQFFIKNFAKYGHAISNRKMKEILTKILDKQNVGLLSPKENTEISDYITNACNEEYSIINFDRRSEPGKIYFNIDYVKDNCFRQFGIYIPAVVSSKKMKAMLKNMLNTEGSKCIAGESEEYDQLIFYMDNAVDEGSSILIFQDMYYPGKIGLKVNYAQKHCFGQFFIYFSLLILDYIAELQTTQQELREPELIREKILKEEALREKFFIRTQDSVIINEFFSKDQSLVSNKKMKEILKKILDITQKHVINSYPQEWEPLIYYVDNASDEGDSTLTIVSYGLDTHKYYLCDSPMELNIKYLDNNIDKEFLTHVPYSIFYYIRELELLVNKLRREALVKKQEQLIKEQALREEQLMIENQLLQEKLREKAVEEKKLREKK